MYLTIGLLIDRSNITISSNNVPLRKFNVKPYGDFCYRLY